MPEYLQHPATNNEHDKNIVPPCPHCAEMEQTILAMEEFIARANTQLLAAEMADMELEQVFSACADPMIVVRNDGIAVRANSKMLELLNKSSEQIIGQPVDQFLPATVCNLANGSRITKQTDIELSNHTGAPCNYIITTSHLTTLDGSPGTLVQYKDITDRKLAEQALEKAHEALKKIAEIDGLTQIANRRTFDETLKRYWQQLQEQQLPLCAILCDIDFFKRYNDTYGHQQGDSCLIKVAQALADSLPDGSGLVARYGGEEFIFLLPDTCPADAATIAELARNNIEQLGIKHSASSVANHVTLSLGVAGVIPSNASSAAQLVAAADSALYLSKEHGRNMVTCRD